MIHEHPADMNYRVFLRGAYYVKMIDNSHAQWYNIYSMELLK